MYYIPSGRVRLLTPIIIEVKYSVVGLILIFRLKSYMGISLVHRVWIGWVIAQFH